MDTKFGVWLKSKGFARLFPVIVVAAMGYLGLRIATALQWGVGLHWYLPVFVLMALMLLLVVYAPVVRAWLVLAAAGISALLLIYGSVHARRLKTVSYQVELGLPGGNRGYGSGARAAGGHIAECRFRETHHRAGSRPPRASGRPLPAAWTWSSAAIRIRASSFP